MVKFHLDPCIDANWGVFLKNMSYQIQKKKRTNNKNETPNQSSPKHILDVCLYQEQTRE
jgi:hypothetical protein